MGDDQKRAVEGGHCPVKRLKTSLGFILSGTLRRWLAGMFVMYYLSVAVWSKEAFASFVDNLSHNTMIRALFVLFLLNVTFRAFGVLRALWGQRLKFILRAPFYVGLVLLLISFFMSVNMRETAQIMVGLGDSVEVSWDNTLYRVERVDSALKKQVLKTEESLIFDYEPSLVLSDTNGVQYSIGAFPPSRVRSSYMHILNFGIGPHVILRKRDAVVSQGYVPLRLTPFGSMDTFAITPYPYLFSLRVLPNNVVKKGTESAQEYDLEKPLYGLMITRGDTMIAKAETDRMAFFDQDWSIGFLPPADWVLLEAVYDPFLPGVVAGLILLPVGVLCFSFSVLLGRRSKPREASRP